MFRLIIILLLIPIIAIYTIFDIVYYFVLKLINKDLALKHSERVVRCIFTFVLLFSGVRAHITGKENIDQLKDEKSYLIISNHRGFCDVIAGYLLFKRHMGIVAKKSISKVPLVSYWMKRINCVFLDRNDLRDGVRMIIDCVNNINNGISMWIFPEGTRCKSKDQNELLEFKSGSFKIAEKTNCFVLPIAFKNTENAFENQKPYVKAVDIYINIGNPYRIEDLNDEDKQDIGKYNQDIIKKLLMEV